MTTDTRRALEPATYTGTWKVNRGKDGEDRLPGVLLVPEAAEDEPPRVAVYIHDGEKVYSAELHPDGSRWRGQEARRTPHPFRLELEAFLADGTLVVFGRLWTDGENEEEDAVHVGASFPLKHEPTDGED